jgi:flagellar protein FliL
MAAPAKTEAPPPAEAAVAAPAPAAAPSGGLKAWIPTIVALVLAPVACWAVVQFLLLPQLKSSLTIEVAEGATSSPGASSTSGGGAATSGGAGKSGAKAAEPGAIGSSYKFENVVVNLAGTMGTRYLKTTFLVTSSQPDITARFEAMRPQLLDVTIGVLSSLSIHDLEEPGAKNVIREKLVNSYNQVLGSRVAEQVYFSDFVVQ